jgi:hypothetical protein
LETFTEGVELTAGAVVERGLNGTNVASSFQLSSEDVVQLATKKLDAAPGNTALVFRQKVPIGLAGPRGEDLAAVHSPVQEALNLGPYHERLVAVTKNEILLNDAGEEGVRLVVDKSQDFAGVAKKLAEYKGKFEFVGSIDLSEDLNRAKFLGNQRNLPVDINQSGVEDHLLRRLTNKWSRYSAFTNNCQTHAAAVLKDLGLR